MSDLDGRLRSLADELTGSGELTPAWRASFLAVPRHQFIPDTIWLPHGQSLTPLRREEDPQQWLDRAYGREAVVIQVDDGNPDGGRGRHITSSASHPGAVAVMLAALDAAPGMSVLEIGTGSGYNAALLAAQLGAQHVTTIEAAHQWWIDTGKPDPHTWQFTVTPHGQRIEQTAATSALPGLTG